MPKRYTVTGSQPVLDHQPGESFDADLPADQEAFLVGIGALAVEDEFDRAAHSRLAITSAAIEDEVKRLNVKSYTVNPPREEKRS